MYIQDAIDILNQIEQDDTVPKNIRYKVKEASALLQDGDGKVQQVKVDRIIQELDDLGNDPNLPVYTRTQIWGVISSLESVQ
ncbi:MAG TPA: UPF0147 family protein [Candidatus Nanoarchaeia archaeon]|nr:UPF0147 family protein [Candidatus Nanoarchaeia archaeon]